jgi:glutathione S-transferase
MLKVYGRANSINVRKVPGSGSGAGFRLRESNTIVRYLAEKHGRSDLYPKDLRQRATVESWMDWASTELAEGMRPVFHGLVVKNPAFADRVEGAAKVWAAQMRVLDDHLARSGPYVTGADFTIGDIPVGLVVNRWFSIDFPKPTLEKVAAYYDLLAQRPPYREHGRNGTP